MESLLTLPIVDYHLVDVTLKVITVMVSSVALLLGLSTVCVPPNARLPLIVGSVALLSSAWFESGIARAWEGGFELAGTSYCVTGIPLASGDRILSWAFGLPAILFSLGLAQMDASTRQFRNLCWSVLALAVLGPFFDYLFLLCFLSCVTQLRRLAIAPAGGSSMIITLANRAALLSVALGILLTEAGHLNLLPLGKSAESVLARGELIRALSDILVLVLPGLALMVCVLNLSVKKQHQPES